MPTDLPPVAPLDPILEKRRIWHALLANTGSVDGAAALLGLTPAALRSRMRRLRLGVLDGGGPVLRRVK